MPSESDPPPQPKPASSDLIDADDGDFAAAFNARLDGWNSAMGLRFIQATAEGVTAEMEIGPRHHQAYGIVHGGVYAGVIETVCSAAAALWARRHSQSVVGLENHTSFLHAIREGKLTVKACPMMRGRRTQVWEATVTDGSGRTVAQGQVRLLSLEAGSALAGEQVKFKNQA